ncbi:MAG: O-antigen ligase family protein [Oscillospiraceae bacterium]
MDTPLQSGRADPRSRVTELYLIIMLLVFPLFTGFSGYAGLTLSKYLFFVIATVLWLLALALVSLRRRLALPRPTAAGITALVFMGVCCLSFLLSPWKRESLLGAGRYDGLVTLLLYALIFLGVSAFSRPGERFAAALGVSVSLCCLVAVLQLFGKDPLWLFPGDYTYYDAGVKYSGAFLGTLGNINILASVLCLAAPLFFGLFACGTEGKSALYLIPMSLSVLILAASASDSGLLALAVCALVGAPVVLTDLRRLRRGLLALAAALAAAALAFAFDGGFVDESFRWRLAFGPVSWALALCAAVCLAASPLLSLIRRPVPPGFLRRLFAILAAGAVLAALLLAYFWPGGSGPLYELKQLLHGNWDDAYGSSRLLIWRSCLELIPERPLFGGGPGTLPLRLDIQFSRFVEETGETLRSYVDNAHNEYLSYLVNTGAAGLAAYLAVLVPAFVLWPKKSGDRHFAAIGLGLAACCVQAFFGLGLCLSAPLFWIFLGLIRSGQPTVFSLAEVKNEKE